MNMMQRLRFWILVVIAGAIVSSCGLFPDFVVLLNKVDFEVAPDANGKKPIVCHIVVAYTQDVYDRLLGFDATKYFQNIEALEKTYRDSIEVFKYDLIPGKNKLDQKIDIKSSIKAKGAFLFAKYLSPGNFKETIGMARSITVRLLKNRMEFFPDKALEDVVKSTLRRP